MTTFTKTELIAISILVVENKNSAKLQKSSSLSYMESINLGNKMVYVNSRYSGIDIDYSKRSEIQDGFNFFETKNLQNSYGIDRSLTELNGYILDPIQFGNLEKIKSIKFYKNGRADIKFRDSKTLNDFLDFYELRKDLEND